MTSCTTAPIVFPTSGASDERPRRPPGIAIDPEARLPEGKSAASSDGSLVVLQTPPDTQAARHVVRSFFRAVAAESLEDLTQLVDVRGRMWSGSGGRRESLQTAWARRFNQLDYTAIAGKLPFREAELEVYRAEEAMALQESRKLPLSPRADELLVRTSVLGPAPSGTRLFGDQLVFLLKQVPGGYRIGEMYEDFRLP